MRPEPSFARSLVAWGNACLRDALPLDAFDGYATRTKHVGGVAFDDGTNRWSDSASWFASVRQRSGALDQLLWCDRVDPADVEPLIVRAEEHALENVREQAAFIRGYLARRRADTGTST